MRCDVCMFWVAVFFLFFWFFISFQLQNISQPICLAAFFPLYLNTSSCKITTFLVKFFSDYVCKYVTTRSFCAQRVYFWHYIQCVCECLLGSMLFAAGAVLPFCFFSAVAVFHNSFTCDTSPEAIFASTCNVYSVVWPVYI